MEELKINLTDWLSEKQQQQERTKERVSAAKAKKVAAKYEPTWEEVWTTGYTSHTGTPKAPILKANLSQLDKERLLEVKAAIETGELGSGVDSLRKLSKAHALNMYKQLRELRREGIITQMVESCPSNYVLVLEEEQFRDLLEKLDKEGLVAIDTETTGVSYEHDYVVGISLTLPVADLHYYIPVRHNVEQKQLDSSFVFTSLAPILEDKKVVGHNIKFDVHMLYKEGINLKNIVMDTMVGMAILNENEPSFALKNLATKYGKMFGFEDKSMTYEELFGKGGFQDTPLDIGLVYAAKDTHLTYKFYKWIDEQLKSRPSLNHVYYDIENPTLAVCIEMERNGFLVDLDFAEEYKQELKGQLEDLEAAINRFFPGVNIDSNVQLAAFLYDELKLDNKGSRSVDKTSLKALAGEYEGISVLLEYRNLAKLLSTYIEPLPQKVWKVDGRLRGSFNQSATVTGRFASNNPNLQNLPAAARGLIVAPAGKVILGKDFSQIEPRILAYMSEDKEFQRPYIEGTDLYSTLASKVFNKPVNECGDGTKYRKMMKVGLLASMYGTSPFTLGQQLGISTEAAVEFLEDFLNTYPQARDFMQELRNQADTRGFVETLHGRKRRFLGHIDIAKRYHAAAAEIKKHNNGVMPASLWGEDSRKIPYALKNNFWKYSKDYGRVARQAVNSTIQGSAADVMKIAMVQVLEVLKEKGAEWKLLATVHDEILIEAPEYFTAQDIEDLDRAMTNVDKFNFPCKTDTVVFRRWGEDEVPVQQYLEAMPAVIS